MKKSWLIFILVIIIIGSAVYLFKDKFLKSYSPPAQTNIQVVVNPSLQPAANIEVVADNLDVPWEIVFLPEGEMLLTERPGRLLKIGKDRKVIEVNGVHPVGEGGLLGLALHPDFKTNNFIYLYFTSQEGGRFVNQVERYKLQNDSLTDRKVIINGILGSSNHDGGRIAFGPDGYLYITTGDAEQTNLAQDKNSLNGKILRVSADGSIPKDNPFSNAVYSYGHRNVQGIAWDNDGNLWATEHGRSGMLSGMDELNFIKKGNNYGWPIIQGDQQREGMVTPVINSGPNETWAPSGATYLNGSIFFAGLRGETLYEAKISNGKVLELKKHLQKEYGRLRTVKVGPDGYLYILTNNRDGRGTPNTGDDKLIRINPKSLQ